VPKSYPRNQDFSRGLQTRAVEDGLPLPDFTTFANVRASDGSADARTGMVRVAASAGESKAIDFVAANTEYFRTPADTRVWQLPLKFTLEVVVALDDKTLTNTVLYAGHTTPSIIIDTASNKWRVRFYDSAGTLDTITTSADALQSTQSLQVVRDGSSLLLRVDNGTETTATVEAALLSRAPAGDLRIGRGASTDYLDGDLDYIRLFSAVRANHNDRLVKYPHPRSPSVLANYNMTITSDDLTRDDSSYENILEGFNTPTSTATLSHESLGYSGITSYINEENSKRLLSSVGIRQEESSI
jgi:hypothetical protein